MNENLQNQNSNQSQKHEFFAQQNRPKRDYDKEPIIIQNYERLFTNLIRLDRFMPIIIAAYLLSFSDFMLETVSFASIFGSLFIFGIIIFVVIRLIFTHCSSCDDKICFYNQHIIFYRKGLQERLIHKIVIKENSMKPFWGNGSLCGGNLNILIAVIYLSITIAFLFFEIKLFFLMVFIPIANVILKAIYFHHINGNFRNFTLFPTILVDTPDDTIEKGFFYPTIKNYLICANSDEYDEIKNWFLQTQNLDIENLKRYYFL